MAGFSKEARSRARELALQAIYQAQIAQHDTDELLRQFHERPDYAHVDRDYFDEVLTAVSGRADELAASLSEFADRPTGQLDPVEFAILMIGYYELESRPDVPYKAIINEAVNLAKRFGAEDGHRYINAVLDRVANALRQAEIAG